MAKGPRVKLQLLTGDVIFDLDLVTLAVEYAREHGHMRPYADFRVFLNDEEVSSGMPPWPFIEIDPRLDQQAAATFVQDLAERLLHVPLPRGLTSEGRLEQVLVPHVREFVRNRLGLSESAVTDAVIHHRHPQYAATRRERVVEIFGAAMTGDIFIRRQEGIGTVFIELKLTKRSLSSGLQRAIGQSLVLRLMHNVICMVVHDGALDAEGDIAAHLAAELWQRCGIALVVRSVAG